MIIIIFGVSGSGKTTIGKLLSKKIGMDFFDADNFHPKSNIDKMAKNIPLTDNDRKPWLMDLANQISKWSSNNGAILACSALKEKYRKILTSKVNKVEFIYLSGSLELIKKRLETRSNHFMQSSLLKSQFNILEVPSYGLHMSINRPPEEIVDLITLELKLNK